ncbi:MAG: hypothetical protein CMJ40_00165 [Phycisphaerae bacterium]|nr:hypothetical protein [Phycisphaerae bacterium]|tara:strand:- start:1470 stop:1916 length:447 start_codon:yes stop_codon:yes gene_type:complete
MSSRRFKFRLQRVLDVRKRVELAARQELSILNREKNLLEEKLRDAERRRIESLHLHRSGMVGKLEIDMLRMHASISRQEAGHAHSLILKRAALEPRIESALRLLLKASSERKGLESLHDQAYEDWKRGCRRAERRDELELSMIGNIEK